MKRILITGGAGFIGAHFTEHVLKNTDWDIVILDKLTYASNGLARLRSIQCFNIERVLILGSNFAQPLSAGVIKEIGEVDYIVHLGAETHVDRSIEDAEPFVMSNVLGTHYMLEFARKQKNLKKFVMFSTDEVYGPAPEGVSFKETDRYNCTNPYAATKAGAEQLALAFANTYKLPVIVTNTLNVFGERQHPEKYIPLCLRKILRGETITVHANADCTKAGSRHWIHARNVSSAVLFLLDHGKFRESYNIVEAQEIDNLTMAKIIGEIVGREPKCVLVDFHGARPGHDLRYSLDGTKLRNLGWVQPMDFRTCMEKVIRWTLEHKDEWLEI